MALKPRSMVKSSNWFRKTLLPPQHTRRATWCLPRHWQRHHDGGARVRRPEVHGASSAARRTLIQRIHAPCIRVRGRAERSYFLYCPPKTRDDAANTRAVYSGAGTRGEKLLSLLSTKNKRRYSEYTFRVFGCGDARREATFFTVHQK